MAKPKTEAKPKQEPKAKPGPENTSKQAKEAPWEGGNPPAEQERAKAEKSAELKKAAGDLLADLIFMQDGKPIKGEPDRDNYTVKAKKDAVLSKAPAEIIAALKEKYPFCVFTWVTK